MEPRTAQKKCHFELVDSMTGQFTHKVIDAKRENAFIFIQKQVFWQVQEKVQEKVNYFV